RISATPAAPATLATISTFLRYHRSIATPAHGPISTAGRASTASVSPVDIADPVMVKTCSGTAMTRSHDPNELIVTAAQSRRKFRLRSAAIPTAGRYSVRTPSGKICSVEIFDLGNRLRNRRTAAGRTIASVAAEAGLSVPYIANLENGRGNP